MRPAQRGLSKTAGLIHKYFPEIFFLFSTITISLVFPNLSFLCPHLIFLVFSWLYPTYMPYGSHLQPVASVRFHIFVVPVSTCFIVPPVFLPPNILFSDNNIRDSWSKNRRTVAVPRSLLKEALPVFYVDGSVHRESMSIIVQQDATIYSFIIFLQTALHVSDDTFTHHQEHM